MDKASKTCSIISKKTLRHKYDKRTGRLFHIGSTNKVSIVSALAEHGHWPGIIHKATSIRTTIGQLGLSFARTSAFAAYLDHETPFCGFSRKIFQAYQVLPGQGTRSLWGEYVQEASPPKSTVGAYSLIVSHRRMISGCTNAERTDSEYAGSDRDWSSDDDSVISSTEITPHYPESLSMRHFLDKFVEASDEFFEVDFSLSTSREATLCTLGASSRLKERRNMMNKYQESDIVDPYWSHIGVKGLLEYLEEDIIQQIHYDMQNQDDYIASQPILLEGNSEHYTTTKLNIQAYNGEDIGDRHGDNNKDDHQAPHEFNHKAKSY
ncbi:uncharacterized protein CLUP02_09235 [Colletotrichum lupini]|uniref:Uncharacterized protein n=1 Tax=Colletotrichum lupini TaxID=145971 RepID=A0A9Q8WHM5_9PEZI|nr:uncharacterized protein CLUP02_09235 [Colletotrichum lupini]UQC83739.1 hypothetical protein CLUP02_09235 [Colletotrichum lupini]